MTEQPEILLVEDNPADVRLTQMAFAEAGLKTELHVAKDGVEALAFLRREREYAKAPRPQLILLDLNLPRKNGRQVLKEVKSDPDLRQIPIVVWTTSRAESDVTGTYDLHANCFVNKPSDLDRFIEVIRSIEHYWTQTAILPTPVP